ncbi:MAG: hypothetical protein HY843_05800 [Bdellovibrio sp.]|nr:hypothetical protein [Bdellovibrio sp.]
MSSTLNLALLKKILTQPTAPFREMHVIKTLTQEFKNFNIPYFQDSVGNIVVGVSSQKEYVKLVQTKSQEPLRIFIAHMDHPGFHGVKWKNQNTLNIKWHGGSPTKHLKNSKVWLANSQKYLGEGLLTKAHLEATKVNISKSIKTGEVKMPAQNIFTKDIFAKSIFAKNIFGGLAFRAPVWTQGKLLYTKGADDLVGSFAITHLALKYLSKKTSMKTPPRFLGLLTRAEEVGFIGAIGHFELGWLKNTKREILCISLETSRALTGAAIGRGPVVRLGDRYTVFNPNYLKTLVDLAKISLGTNFQKKVMDGGTCEGTIATAYGFPAIGISVPLGNYHNQSFEGGIDSRGLCGPAPEFVHLKDVNGLLTLCEDLLKPGIFSKNPWTRSIAKFRRNFKKYTPLLKSAFFS